MSGLSLTLNTAKLAIEAQQYGLNVTGHNIANVNSESYSRQRVPLEATTPTIFGGKLLGTGVTAKDIVRISNEFLEDKLIKQKSDLSMYENSLSKLNIIEGFLNENTDSGISSLLPEFWNGWHDLSNNPDSMAERITVFEKGALLSERFDTLNEDLMNLEVNTTLEIKTALSNINSIAKEIASVNNELTGLESGRVANDLRDKRTALLGDLSKLIDIKSFEQPKGDILVTVASGSVLVNKVDTFPLDMPGTKILYETANGGFVDITDRVSGGETGGLLNIRDEVITKYKTELDLLAKELVWSVNYQHSQGTGLNFFTDSVTGTYETDPGGNLSTLDFGDKIDYSKDFKMWIKDSSLVPSTYAPVLIDMAESTANPLFGGTAADANATYNISIAQAGIVGTDDIDFNWTSSAGGTGTVTMPAPASNITIDGITLTFNNTDQLISGNTLSINTDAAGTTAPLVLSASGSANSVSDTYKFETITGGTIGTDNIEIKWTNATGSDTFILDNTVTYPANIEVDGMTLTFTSGILTTNEVFNIFTDTNATPSTKLPSEWHFTLNSFTSAFNTASIVAGGGVTASVANNTLTFTPDSNAYSFAFADDGSTGFEDSGLTAALGINTFFTGHNAMTMDINTTISEARYIASAQIDADTGDFGVGDNSNAIEIMDLQYKEINFSRWTFKRGDNPFSKSIAATSEGFYNTTVTSLGITSMSTKRSVDFSESLLNRMTEQRDAVSAVSLDEEMINMMKYQHAFTVASKLLSVTDEMMNTLIAVR